jgi:hypothetical protein
VLQQHCPSTWVGRQCMVTGRTWGQGEADLDVLQCLAPGDALPQRQGRPGGTYRTYRWAGATVPYHPAGTDERSDHMFELRLSKHICFYVASSGEGGCPTLQVQVHTTGGCYQTAAVVHVS